MRLSVPLDDRFFPDFLVDVRLLEALLFVAAFVVEALFLVEAPARFLAPAAPVFLLAAFLVPFFLVPFLVPRELPDPFEDRLLLDFLALEPLRAFVVGILSSLNRPAQHG